jgi:hypothetical protein
VPGVAGGALPGAGGLKNNSISFGEIPSFNILPLIAPTTLKINIVLLKDDFETYRQEQTCVSFGNIA